MIYWQDIQVYFWVGLVVSAFACGGFSAYLADAKGHNFVSWFLLGFSLGIFGLIAAAGLPMRQESVASRDRRLTKKCPMCAEQVRLEARVCPYCGYEFNDREKVIEKLGTIVTVEEGLPIAKQAEQLLEELESPHNG